MRHLLFVLLTIPLCTGVENWQPLLEPDVFSKGHFQSPTSFSSLVAQRYQPTHLQDGGQCELYKVGFTQDLYFQYIQYKSILPEMKEFTLCYWNKFTNHSTDHPVFSYAVDGQPRAISSWVSNTERSSYYSLSVEGHTFYRLNYPLRLNRWYHTCQSWNGKTGEWQIWVNAERVGRGFHNRLVGHTIPPGGTAITGQEQTQIGGGFLEGKGAGGMLGEITMVQLYNVALTAGKAHKDHKHHHAHRYDHNGILLTTTPTPPPMPRPTQPTHPLLTGGQLNPNVALNLAAQQAQQQQQQAQFVPGQNFDAQLINGQFVGNLVTQQLSQGSQVQRQPGFQFQPPSVQFQSPGVQFQQQQGGPQTFRPDTQSPIQLQAIAPSGPAQGQVRPGPLINSGLVHPSLVNPANVQIIDVPFETHQIFKRQDEPTVAKADAGHRFGRRIVRKRVTKRQTKKEESKQKKRELILPSGEILDDSLFGNDFDQSLLYGLAGIGQNEPVLQKQRQSEDREPAEAEVAAVMNVCSGCDDEPFGKALVFGWRTVPKKLYSGAFYTPAVPECRVF